MESREAVQAAGTEQEGEVATHVLVPEDHADKLRELAKKTRVNQSEYLREAVDDLLSKYVEGSEGAESK